MFLNVLIFFFCYWHRTHADFLKQVYLRISRIVRRSPIARGVNAIDRAHESRARVSDGFVIARCPAHFNRELNNDGESIQRAMSKILKLPPRHAVGNSPKRRKNVRDILLRRFSLNFWITLRGQILEHLFGTAAELFDLRDCAFERRARLLHSGPSVTGRRLRRSFANPKSGLKQTRSRSRRKAGFPTSVVCTLSRVLLSC